MSVKHIISYGNDGLGGRVTCCMNALMVAKYYQCKITIVWKNNGYCQSDYKTLFKDNDSFEVHSRVEHIFTEKTEDVCHVHNRYKKKYRNIKAFCSGVIKDRNTRAIQRKQGIKNKFLKFVGIKNNLTVKQIGKAFIEKDIAIIEVRKDLSKLYNIQYKNIFNDYLKPVNDIQLLIDSFIYSNNNFKKMLGVQVRRGDLVNNPMTMRRFVPTERYFVKIDEYFKTGNYEKIFLATESNDVILEFKRRYKNRVVIYPIDEYSRSEKGVIFALIDMILLSKCSHIISGKSQIPLTAARIGNVAVSLIA